jgi:hypothetical protein
LTMHTRHKLILAVFYLVLPVVVAGAQTASLAQDAKAAPETAKAPAAPSSPSAGQAGLTYKAEGLKDPFRARIKRSDQPVVEEKKEDKTDKPLPSLTIEGIIWGGKFPQAIVNGQVAKVGDSITAGTANAGDKVRIDAISRDGITVFFNNRTYEVSSPAQASLTNIARKAKGGTDEKQP